MISLKIVSSIILAAGQSSRMGRQKMLLPWRDRSVLGHIIWTLHSSGLGDILVVVGGYRELIEQEALSYQARVIYNSDYVKGEMLSSIQTGIQFLPDFVEYCLVALGDNPQMEQNTILSLLQSEINLGKEIVMPSYQMRRGHPWLIHRNFWPEILALKSPQTMRDFFRKNEDRITYVKISSPSILQDLDTPDDYLRQRPNPNKDKYD